MCWMTRDRRGNIQVSSRLKWCLFGTNFLFWVIGLLLILNSMYQFSVRESAGFFLSTSKTLKDKVDRFGSNSQEATLANVFVFLGDVSVGFLCVGIVLVVVTFFGFLGALRENRCLLSVYDFLLFLLIVTNASGLAYFLYHFTIKSQPADVVGKMIKSKIEEYYSYEDVTLLLDFVQSFFQCCGVSIAGRRSRDIWNQHNDFVCDERNLGPFRCSVPSSCCKTYLSDVRRKCLDCLLKCGRDALDADGMEFPPKRRLGVVKSLDASRNAIYEDDCAVAVGRWFSSRIFVVAAVLGSIIFFEVLAFCAGETLKRHILACQEAYRKDTERNRTVERDVEGLSGQHRQRRLRIDERMVRSRDRVVHL